MHRSGSVAGANAAGAPAASRGALELEHPSSMPGASGFHWGAMLAGHHAAGIMQPPLATGSDYAAASAHHASAHPSMPMDLHVHQGFPYYR